jgi:hypothetical protein
MQPPIPPLTPENKNYPNEPPKSISALTKIVKEQEFEIRNLKSKLYRSDAMVIFYSKLYEEKAKEVEMVVNSARLDFLQQL